MTYCAIDAEIAPQPLAHDDGSEQSADQRQAGQPGCIDSASEAGNDSIAVGRLTNIADDSDVLDQLLGDLGISERDQPRPPLRDLPSVEPPQQRDNAAARPDTAKSADTHQRRKPQAAASAADSHTEPATCRDASHEGAAAVRSAAKPGPPPEGFMLGTGYPCAAAASEPPTGCRQLTSAAASCTLLSRTEPHQPAPHKRRETCSTVDQQSPRVASQTEYMRWHAASSAPAGRARGSRRHRPADSKAEALLLCPITKVGRCSACLRVDALKTHQASNKVFQSIPKCVCSCPQCPEELPT